MVSRITIRLALVCCLLSAVLCGCSHPKKETGKVPTDRDARSRGITLRFGVLGAKQEADLANALVKGFEAKCRQSEHPDLSGHPKIKINVEPVAGMGYDIKLVMQSAAGTLPDDGALRATGTHSFDHPSPITLGACFLS